MMRHAPFPARSRAPARLPALLAAALILAAGAAQAACYADYKAKQDDPLRLHYGVAEIRGTCDEAAAADELRPRLAAAGWELLQVEGVFDETGLQGRRQNAGDFYLRF